VHEPETQLELTGGQAVVQCLRQEGVRHVFNVPGESFLAALDAFHDAPEITLITNRQEGGAAFMAEAYAKATGRVGVCFVTRGPGATNASIGVHVAAQDSSPLLLLVGQVPRSHRGREAFQEIDYTRFFGSIAKWVVEVEQAAKVPEVLHRAMHLARSGRPGPVVVSFPEDVLSERMPMALGQPYPLVRPQPEPQALATLMDKLHAAERPLLLVGGGIAASGARDALVAFCERFGVGVVTSFRRMDALPNSHPLYLGNVGIGGASARQTLAEADTILVVGDRLSEVTTADYTFPAPTQRLLQIDIDPAIIGRQFVPAAAIVADARAALTHALELPAPAVPAARQAWNRAQRQAYEAWSTPPVTDRAEITMERVLGDLNAALPADAVVTVDAGNFSGWIHRYRRFEAPSSFLGPTAGAMGYGVPAAVAAKLAHPERVVVGTCGDGGFLMTGQELATAMQHGLRVILLVFNNGALGTIRMHQERHYPSRVIGSDLRNPDFAALARSYGALGVQVRLAAEFAPALQQALAHEGPALIEVCTELEQLYVGGTLSDLRAQSLARQAERKGGD